MADLEDLHYTSILDMTNDEALEHLRQIRLSRRVKDPVSKTSTKQVKKQSEANIIKSINSDMAAELLKLLEAKE